METEPSDSVVIACRFPKNGPNNMSITNQEYLKRVSSILRAARESLGGVSQFFEILVFADPLPEIDDLQEWIGTVDPTEASNKKEKRSLSIGEAARVWSTRKEGSPKLLRVRGKDGEFQFITASLVIVKDIGSMYSSLIIDCTNKQIIHLNSSSRINFKGSVVQCLIDADFEISFVSSTESAPSVSSFIIDTDSDKADEVDDKKDEYGHVEINEYRIEEEVESWTQNNQRSNMSVNMSLVPWNYDFVNDCYPTTNEQYTVSFPDESIFAFIDSMKMLVSIPNEPNVSLSSITESMSVHKPLNLKRALDQSMQVVPVATKRQKLPRNDDYTEFLHPFTLKELKHCQKRGQILRDLDRNKVNMLSSHSQIHSFFDGEVGSIPVIFVINKVTAFDAQFDTFITAEGNHRITALGCMDLTKEQEETVVFARCIRTPENHFQLAWKHTGSLDFKTHFESALRPKVNRDLIPVQIFERSLKTIASEIRRSSSVFETIDEIKAYQPFFTKFFSEAESQKIIQGERSITEVHSELVTIGIVAEESTNSIRSSLDPLYVFFMERKTKNEFVGEMNVGFKWPTREHVIQLIYNASRIDDSKTSEALAQYRTTAGKESSYNKLKTALISITNAKKACIVSGARMDATPTRFKNVNVVDDESFLVFHNDISVSFEAINAKRLNIICFNPTSETIKSVCSKMIGNVGTGFGGDATRKQMPFIIAGPEVLNSVEEKFRNMKHGAVNNAVNAFTGNGKFKSGCKYKLFAHDTTDPSAAVTSNGYSPTESR